MDDVKEYFINKKEELNIDVPVDFIDKLIDLYDYDVLQQVKDSLYYYNEQHIADEILNYLFAINFEIGDIKKNVATNDTIDISEEYLKGFEAKILGETATINSRKLFRKEVLNEYITQTLSQEIRVSNIDITATKQYLNLFERYSRNLKENVLESYINNDNFRRAIIDYGTTSFYTYDNRVKRDVSMLINNMVKKYSYGETGAKQVSIYVLDKKIDDKY